MLEAIGFDFDDTITKSQNMNWILFAREILKKFGDRFPNPPRNKVEFEQLEREVARKIVELRQRIKTAKTMDVLKEYGVSASLAEIQSVVHDYGTSIDEYYARLTSSSYVKGFKKFLEQLVRIKELRARQGKRLVLFIASGADLPNLEAALYNLGIRNHFDIVRGNEKNKTEIMREVMVSHNITPDNMLFFGDQAVDHEAAKETGCRYIGLKPRVPGQDHSTEEFRRVETILEHYDTVGKKIKRIDRSFGTELRDGVLANRTLRKRSRPKLMA
ncbi:MAG: HAD family hydrolase [Candidatus ainarchaeum sp.]|nr:HAD family hydrolase [Candidatus ainarchaeum sp.]